MSDKLEIGIASLEAFKARTLAIAQVQYKPRKDEPRTWCQSPDVLAKLHSPENRGLLALIADR